MAQTKSDPTGQARHRSKATRRFQARLTIAERDVKALFRAIPRKRTTQAILPNKEHATIYAYDLSVTGAIALQIDIRDSINRSLEVSGLTPPAGWWWEPLIEQPYRQGTVEEIRDFNQLINQAIAAGVTGAGGLPLLITDPADVLLSAEYLSRVRSVTVRNYGLIQSLSERTVDQVI